MLLHTYSGIKYIFKKTSIASGTLRRETQSGFLANTQA